MMSKKEFMKDYKKNPTYKHQSCISRNTIITAINMSNVMPIIYGNQVLKCVADLNVYDLKPLKEIAKQNNVDVKNYIQMMADKAYDLYVSQYSSKNNTPTLQTLTPTFEIARPTLQTIKYDMVVEITRTIKKLNPNLLLKLLINYY